MKRVRIFIDNSNFTIQWSKDALTSGFGVKWPDLPKIVLEALTAKGFVGPDADLRGTTVYASVKQKGEGEQERFLHGELDQYAGYTVRVSYRKERQCSHDKAITHHVEKGVDTKIVCDMLALAMRDHYDLAVIISDDEDLVPSVQCVQDILDRQIIHLGFRKRGQEIRSAAWGHLILDDYVDTLKGELRPGDNCSPRPNGCAPREGARKKDHRRRRHNRPPRNPSVEEGAPTALKVAFERAAT